MTEAPTTNPRESSRIYSNTPQSRRALREAGHEPNALRYTSAFNVQQLRFHYRLLREAGASAYLARRALWSAAWGATLYPAPTFEVVALTPAELPRLRARFRDLPAPTVESECFSLAAPTVTR